MKVIVQDLETGAFLGADGRWVTAKAEARDFHTLMRAYAFAKDHTAKHFKILLHCPDDQYSATIIAGVGAACPSLAAFGCEGEMETPELATSCAQSRKKFLQLNRFNTGRNDLN